MSPDRWDGAFAFMFVVDSDGDLDWFDGRVSYTSYGLRPVINLRSDVTFTSGGTGTQTNPYVVQ